MKRWYKEQMVIFFVITGMKGSIQIAKFANIPVFVHWSFGLMFVWVGYIGFTNGWELASMGWFSLFMLTLFFCIVLHEFGHALTAKYYGVSTRDIILSPIGGVARLERLPEKPLQEFFVALAGPAVNIVIAIIIFTLLFLFSNNWTNVEMSDKLEMFSIPANFPILLLGMNIGLAGFNLLPAFPMDGGRILRSLLSIKLGRKKATRIASLLGQGIAILFIGYGVFNLDFAITFIGMFVFLMAANEYRVVRYDHMMETHKVEQIYRLEFTKLYELDTIGQALQALNKGEEKSFLIFNKEEKVIGVLHDEFIQEAIKQKDEEALVQTYSSQSYEQVRLGDSLKDLYGKMIGKGYSVLPVVDDENEIIGVVDRVALSTYAKNIKD